MPRPRPRIPGRPRLHRPSGQAVCDYYDPGTGQRRTVRLGPWGSKEADREYARLVADLAALRTLPDPTGPGLLVSELAARFLKHARDYYSAGGKPTNEYTHFRHAVGVLAAVEGDAPAREFGPVAFKRVREAMVARGWARPTVNQQARRVRACFRWAAENELVPAAVWQALCSVRGLARGRTPARETEPVRPVDEARVAATLPHLPPPVAAMVRLQLLTGCRPQDVCRMRADEVDRSGPVWVYRPGRHKNDWRGKVREVWVGPRAQEVLGPWLLKAGGGPVFCPARWVAEMHAARSDARKTPLYPSHARRNAGKRTQVPKRPPRESYSAYSYGGAIRRACRKAAVEPWTPLQLRHTAGTLFRREFGIEVARVLLGHGSAVTTEIYAEADRAKAAEAMRKVG